MFACVVPLIRANELQYVYRLGASLVFLAFFSGAPANFSLASSHPFLSNLHQAYLPTIPLLKGDRMTEDGFEISEDACCCRTGNGCCHNKEIGAQGERAAARFLEHLGYEILERNWTCPAGEADLIALDGSTVVFIEVKTRTSLRMGLPAEAITSEKRNRYERIAGWFLRDYERVDVFVRFDVIAILAIGNERALVRHYINAFGSA